jgi:hypothetical protein
MWEMAVLSQARKGKRTGHQEEGMKKGSGPCGLSVSLHSVPLGLLWAMVNFLRKHYHIKCGPAQPKDREK